MLALAILDSKKKKKKRKKFEPDILRNRRDYQTESNNYTKNKRGTTTQYIAAAILC